MHDYFQKQTRARVQQLCTELHSMTLHDSSMGDFLLNKKLWLIVLLRVEIWVLFSNTLMLLLKGFLQDCY